MEKKNEKRTGLWGIAEPLLVWYEENKRDWPWRADGEAYHVWLSEIMLQQTRTVAVVPYYLKFLRAYPTVEALAAARDEDVMKNWEGLGYYSRARNLLAAARTVCEKHQGKFPADVRALLALPGVGTYTAGAVASIAFGLPEPAVDGNVLRVVMRLLGDDSDIAEEATKRRVAEQLREVYPSGPAAGKLTQAIMELGENVCIPVGRPRCIDCPLSGACRALAENRVEELPRKSPKKPRVIEMKTVFVMTFEGCLAIRKRPAKGLLAGLWELPSAEGHLGEDEARAWLGRQGFAPDTLSPLPPATHIFTHKEWHMNAYQVTLAAPPQGLVLATPEALRTTYPIPRAFQAFLKV